MNATWADRSAGTDQTLTRGIGTTGRVTVSFTMAGGLMLGGVIVALRTLDGALSGHGIFMTASGLFVIGAALGALHGVVLGYFGREADVGSREALRRIGHALLYTIPGAAVAWLVTVWVGLTLVAAMGAAPGAVVLVGVAWLAAIAILAWAAVQGRRALANAYRRWPDPVLGTALTAAVFGALLVTLVTERPTLWMTPFRVTEVGAVLLAAFLTIWVAGPAITLALRVLRDLPGHRRVLPATPGRAAGDMALGLVVGAAVGLLAVPFANDGATTLMAGSVLAAMGQVLLDETLLRLFLLSGVAWLVMKRWQGVRSDEAAMGAVIVVAAVQVLLYLPGVIAAGFPTVLAAASFTVAAILVPAVLFGVVYWARGFPAALTAHAAAAMMVLILI